MSDSVICSGIVRPVLKVVNSFLGIQWIGLHSGLERQECIPVVAHFEDSSKPVLSQISNLEDLEFRRYMAEIELVNQDVVHDNRWLRRFVQCSRKQLLGPCIERCVGRQRRPVEVERHIERNASSSGREATK
jgi:hypothetical protein